MNINKKMAGAIATSLVVLGGVGVGIAVTTHKSVSEDLRSHAWSFTDTAGDGFTAHFQKNNMQVANWGSYAYKINEDKQTITFWDTDKYAESEKMKYKIKKSQDGYTFTPNNSSSKENWGTVTLEINKD